MAKKRNSDVTAASANSPKEAKNDRMEFNDRKTKEQRVCSCSCFAHENFVFDNVEVHVSTTVYSFFPKHVSLLCTEGIL